MSNLPFARVFPAAPLAAAVWLATEPSASAQALVAQTLVAQTLVAQTLVAQTLVAQTGVTKTAICWAIVLLCIGLGLLVVCRPSARAATNGRRK